MLMVLYVNFLHFKVTQKQLIGILGCPCTLLIHKHFHLLFFKKVMASTPYSKKDTMKMSVINYKVTKIMKTGMTCSILFPKEPCCQSLCYSIMLNVIKQ